MWSPSEEKLRFAIWVPFDGTISRSMFVGMCKSHRLCFSKYPDTCATHFPSGDTAAEVALLFRVNGSILILLNGGAGSFLGGADPQYLSTMTTPIKLRK